jgi:hypothetical protein
MSITLFTADEIMQRGLLLVGYKLKQTVQRSTKVKWFRENFGSVPIVYAEVLEDLQMAPNLEDRLVVTDPDKDLRHFLHGIFFLRKYPTESDGSPRFDMSDRTARDSKWALVKKLQALKDKKIVWPEEWTAEGDIPVFLVSVDGIHCRVFEPSHGSWSKNPAYYSHKFRQSALAYEVALSVFQNKCVSLNGPYPASTSDGTIFKNGIRDKIPVGRRAIVDNGYKGEEPKYSKPNPLDSEGLRRFKGRVRSRQECFNSRLKAFQCLKQDFRHGEEKHKMCFEAVAVICQYQLENGSPLFDV